MGAYSLAIQGVSSAYPRVGVWTDSDIADLQFDFVPEFFAYSDEGGPSECSARVTGAINDLITLASFVGRCVDVYDTQGTCVWWGRLHEVRINDGDYEHTISIDQIANSVSLVYYKVTSSAETTGTRTQTDWVESDNQSLYGRHQLVASRTKLTEAEAAQEIALLLAQSAAPEYSVLWTKDMANTGATLVLKGEWFYMSRTYFSDTSSIEMYTDSPDVSQHFGEGSGIAEVVQGFSVPAAGWGPFLYYNSFQAEQVVLQIGRSVEAAQPSDTVRCEIWSSDWVQVGRLVTDTAHGSDATYPFDGTDATDVNVLVDGYNVADSKPYQPYWLRAGVIFSCVNGLGAREEMRVVSIDGAASPYPEYRVPITIARAQNGTTASGYSRKLPIYVKLPSALLATSQAVSASAIPTSPAEVTFTFTSPFTVDGTQRYLLVRRTESPNATTQWLGRGMYQVRMVAARGYARGDAYLRVKNADTGSAGVYRPPLPNDGMMWFRVTGLRDTGAQLVNMAANYNNGFPILWTGIDEGNNVSYWPHWSSGVRTSPYRAGDRNTQEEISKLLKRGTSSNRGMYAIVSPSRYLGIYEEDYGEWTNYLLRRDGVLQDGTGREIEPLPPPIGKYVVTEGWVSPARDVNLQNAFYVKEARYDCRSNKLELRPRSAPPLGQLPGVTER